MPQTALPHYLYDLKGRPQYMAYRAYQNLLDDIVFLSGWRGRLEKVWLAIQKLYPRLFVKERLSLQHWTALSQQLDAPVTGALFWQTAWYKTTQFVGGITTDDRRFFVKAYKHGDEAMLAKQQSEFINTYFKSDFTTVPVTAINDRLVFYPLLPHVARNLPIPAIEKKLLGLNLKHMMDFSQALKPALDYINLNLPNLMQSTGHGTVWSNARHLLMQCPALPMVPIHGDATPWNMFFSDQKLPVLIDYERAGWHVPFYDVWHFYCQPLIMQDRLPNFQDYILRLQPQTGQDLTFLYYTGLLYLLDQLAYDLQDLQDYPKQQRNLSHVIDFRIRLINILLHDLSDAAR